MLKKIAMLCLAGLLLPAAAARATTINYGTSTQGFCCFNVSATDVSGGAQVTVSLVSGALSFVNSGNGNNHPGFAFNLNTLNPISLSFPSGSIWTGTTLSTSAATAGNAEGAFQYYFNNPGSGAGDAGPLVFTILGTGVTSSSFVANADGYLFAADIQSAAGGTGEAGLTGTPVLTPTPEPSSLLLLGTGILGSAGLLRRRVASALGRG